MPRIKEIEIAHKSQRHKFVIWYTEKEHFHVKGGLDSDMLDRVRGLLIGNEKYDYKPEKAQTIEVLRQQLQRFVELYWKAVESSKRIILLSASFSSTVMKNYEVQTWGRQDDGEPLRYHEEDIGFRSKLYDNPRLNCNNHTSNSSLSIEFSWKVADMVKGAETSIIEMQRNKKGEWVQCGTSFTFSKNSRKEYVIIDYTPEREAFFITLEEQFKMLADKVAAFIVNSDDEIAALIDSNKLALLPSS